MKEENNMNVKRVNSKKGFATINITRADVEFIIKSLKGDLKKAEIEPFIVKLQNLQKCLSE